MSISPTSHFTSEINLVVNSRRHTLQVAHHWTLLHLLREVLDLTGAKVGCDRGECGACTILMDGLPVYACQLLAIQANGKEVLTIEGLATGSELHFIQKAFLEEDSGQCGYCTPGFIMSTHALLRSNPSPTEQEVRYALLGNLCRCNAYGRIIQGVMTAARAVQEGSS